jgi:hypothetical protein
MCKMESTDKYREFCIKEAHEYIKKANEALEAADSDPKQWYDDNIAVAKTFTQLFPLMYHILQTHSSPPEN